MPKPNTSSVDKHEAELSSAGQQPQNRPVNANIATQATPERGSAQPSNASGSSDLEEILKVSSDNDTKSFYTALKQHNNGADLLWEAVYRQQFPLMEILLKLGFKNFDTSPADGPNRGKSALWLAAFYQQWSLVKKMLELDAKSFDTFPTGETGTGMSTLCLAACSQQWLLVVMMLLKGAKSFDIFPIGEHYSGLSVLWMMAVNQQWLLVEVVLRLGAKSFDTSPVIGPNRGRSAVWLAAYSQQWPLVEMMLKQGAKNYDTAADEGIHRGLTLFCLAAISEKWPLVEMMLKGGAKSFDVYPDATVGLSPLWLAACCQQWPLVEMMIKLGAKGFDIKPTEGAFEGKSPLCFAVYHGATEALKVLFFAGASLDIPPLQHYFAAKCPNGDYGVTKKLLEAAETLFKAAYEKIAPLNFMESLKILGRSINAKRGGFTALEHAIISGQDSVAEQLLYHGADLDMNNQALSKFITRNAVVFAFAKLKLISNSLKQLEELYSEKNSLEKENQNMGKQQSELSGEVTKKAQELLNDVEKLTPKARSKICYRLAKLLETESSLRLIPTQLILSAFQKVARTEVQSKDYEHAQAQIVHYSMIIQGERSFNATTGASYLNDAANSLDERECIEINTINRFGSALNSGSKLDDGLFRITAAHYFKEISDNNIMEELFLTSDPRTEMSRQIYKTIAEQKKQIAELKKSSLAINNFTACQSTQSTLLAYDSKKSEQATSNSSKKFKL